MTLYHATTKENAIKIIGSQCIRPGMDGVVYLADSPDNAIKFVKTYIIAMGGKDFIITVFPVTISETDESKVIETHDHSEEYFKCKAYGYKEIIPFEMIGNPCDYHYVVNEKEGGNV